MLSIFSSLPLGLKDTLDPPEHGVTEGLQVLPAEARGPQLLDLADQLGQGPIVLSPQLVFEEIPAILYGIQIRAVPWPVHDLE